MDRRQLLTSSAAALALLTGNTASARPIGDIQSNSGDKLSPMSEDHADNGLITVTRDNSFETVVEGITTAIETNENLTLITTLDHASNAASVGEDLCSTTVIMFGNPALGTPLMQRERTVGIDLPQKMLVWEDDGVHVTYNDPQYLATRHGLEDADETLTTIAQALETIATG